MTTVITSAVEKKVAMAHGETTGDMGNARLEDEFRGFGCVPPRFLESSTTCP